MELVQILPIVAAALWAGIAIGVMSGNSSKKSVWLLPAGLCVLFFAWSLAAVIHEGPLGFWPEHTRHLWGNQIWFDLLLSIGVGWALLVPQAKVVNMRPLPWFVLIACTGSIGLLAMFARLLYLREHAGSPQAQLS